MVGNTMKNVLFINMPVREHVHPNNVPLGPLSLASHLNKNGYNSEILDLNTFKEKSRNSNYLYTIIKDKLGTHDAWDAICLSGLITTLWYQEITAKIIKKLLPDVSLFSGGGLATDIKRELFNWIPELDGINIGPGELNILPMIKSKKRKKIWIGRNPDDLDDYSDMDYSLVDVDKYISKPIWGSLSKNSSTTPFTMKRSLNAVTSRGCPFDCNFCDREATGGKVYRERTAHSLLNEMNKLKNIYDIDFLGYLDDNAILDKRRIKVMSEYDVPVRWGAHARLDDIGSDKEKAELLKDINCIYLGFGGESANMDVLKAMNKGAKVINSKPYKYDGYIYPEVYVKALEYCRSNNIHPNLTWMMGYPTETLKQLQDTISFILFMEDEGYVERRYNNRSIFVATAYPNTKLFNTYKVKKRIYEAFKNFKEYVYMLGDATKTIAANGVLLNYSDMSDETFLEARKFIENNEIEKVLEIKE